MKGPHQQPCCYLSDQWVGPLSVFVYMDGVATVSVECVIVLCLLF